MYLIKSPCCAFLPVREDACISDFGERDTAAGKAGFLFFIPVCVVGRDERKSEGSWSSAGQGECLIIRPTFTDSFPLCALSIPHS